MQPFQLTTDKFKQQVESEGILVIDASADWCPDCRRFEPVFERVATENQQHRFATLNIDQEPDLKSKLDVRYIPTLVVYRNGQLLYNNPGGPPEEVLQEIIGQAETLDIDALKFQSAEANA